MTRQIVVLLAIFAAVAFAAGPRTEVFNRIQAPPGWLRGVRAPHTAPMSLKIGVKQQNLDWLEVCP